MTPLSFDSTTAHKIVGDAWARKVEAKARLDADSKCYDPPSIDETTYWNRVQSAMRVVIYREQYTKRMARNERKLSVGA